jgi:superfamily II DNA or RNA helicase
VLCDEAHLASANSLTGIVQKCVNADYRVGVTGTLNGQKIHSLQLESLFGPVKKVITTKELMEKKQVTELAIKCLVLKYPEHLTKLTQKLKYPQELEYLISNPERNKFIKNLVLSLKGNTLLLYQYVEKHGDVLYDLISKSKYAADKQIYYIHGNIKAEERESIRKAMETQNNVILIGSVGTVSTGTNIKNLHNIIFASPSKSRVRNLQAIGRVLRLNENKNKAVLYDFADDLRYKKHQNYTLTHFYERVKIYNEEKFDFKIINVNMESL